MKKKINVSLFFYVIVLSVFIILSVSKAVELTTTNPVAISICSVINQPGEYILNSDLTGAPNPATPLPGNACIVIASQDVIFNCDDHKLTGAGISDPPIYGVLINSSANGGNVTVKNCNISSYNYGIYLHNVDNVTVKDSNATNGDWGVYLDNSDYNMLIRNDASGNRRGFFLFVSKNNTLIDNKANHNTYQGFVTDSVNNQYIRNTANYNERGFFFNYADNTVVDSNNAHHNVNEGFDYRESILATFTNNSASYNGGAGFGISQVEDIAIEINRAFENRNGMHITESDEVTLTNNTVYGNDNFGIYVGDKYSHSVFLIDNHLYGNGGDFDFRTIASTYHLKHDKTIFDSSNGNYDDYTTLSINDTTVPHKYYIDWVSLHPSYLPSGYGSFEEKYVRIFNITPTISIDEITWYWTDAEVLSDPKYHESSFTLQVFDGTSWTILNETPDTVGNTFSLSNFNNPGIVGILYSLDNDGDGVPNNQDDCVDTYGSAEYNGCPSAIICKVTSNNVKVTGVPGVQPLEGATCKAFNSSDSCVMNNHPSTQDIIENCAETISCITNSSGLCLMGVEPIPFYVAVEEEAFSGKYPGHNIGEVQENRSKTVKLMFLKSPDGSVSPSKSSMKEGSVLWIHEPQFVVWNGTEAYYPFVFETDENWTIDVCVDPPHGYKVAEGIKCSQQLVAGEQKAILFKIIEVGSIPDDVKVRMTLTDPKGKKQQVLSSVGTRLTQKLANAKGVAIDKNGVITGKASGHPMSLPGTANTAPPIAVLPLLLVFLVVASVAFVIEVFMRRMKKN